MKASIITLFKFQLDIVTPHSYSAVRPYKEIIEIQINKIMSYTLDMTAISFY